MKPRLATRTGWWWRRPEPRCGVCDGWYFPLGGWYVRLPSARGGIGGMEVCSLRCAEQAWMARLEAVTFWEHEVE